MQRFARRAWRDRSYERTCWIGPWTDARPDIAASTDTDRLNGSHGLVRRCRGRRLTIGSGIFRVPARSPPKTAAWDDCASLAAGGVITGCGALTSAAGGEFPRAGGICVLREAYGRPPAFLFGWSCFHPIRASARHTRLRSTWYARAVRRCRPAIRRGPLVVGASGHYRGVRLGRLGEHLNVAK